MYECQPGKPGKRIPMASEDEMAGGDDLWPPWGSGRPGGRPTARGGGRTGVSPATGGRNTGGRPGAGRDSAGRDSAGRDWRTREERGAERAHRLLHEAPPRGRRAPTLSRDEIVDAAIAIADSDGAEAISMRKIAQVLRAGAMSLYWHVASKERLLELMLDTLMGEIQVPEPTGDWRADLQAQARSTREMLLRHRWVMDFIAARPAFGPNTLRMTDRSLAALDNVRIDTATAVNILQAVSTYVSGAVLREFQELRAQREQERMGIDEQDFSDGLAAWRRKLAATGQFDHFLRILSDNVDPDAAETRNERFEFGLECMLDGIAAKLARLSANG
jgi:AcrR family transcriptional regulator